MFCPKCGSITFVKKAAKKKVAKKKAASKTKKKAAAKTEEKKEVAPKKILACPSCGHTEEIGDKEQISLKEKVGNDEEIVAVIEEDVNTLPLVEVNCEKCGHQKAYFWTMQTRSADEPETKFMKCESCSHTWREED